MSQKPAKKESQAPTPATTPKPIIHLLALTGAFTPGYVPVQLVLRGETVIGCLPGTDRPQAWGIALDVLKILSTRLYVNRGAFKSEEPPADLKPAPGGNLRAVGIIKSADGRYLPVAVKIEDGKVVKSVPLFSSPLALNEACSVYRGRFNAFFIERKLIVE